MVTADSEPQPTDDRSTLRSRLSAMQITFAMIVAFGLILALNFSSRIAAGQPLQEAYNAVEAEVEQLRTEQASLIAIRDYSQSDAYAEQWARSEGKMVRDGETLVVPVAMGVPDTATTPVAVQSVPVITSNPEPENWMLWWNLFMDAPPPSR